MSAETEKKIIPLADSQEILSWFGIGSSSRGYQRWAREDGFRQVDLEDVLIEESEAILNLDWRECLGDAVAIMIRQLEACGIPATASLNADENEGTLEIQGDVLQIKYVPSDNDNFDGIVDAINRVISQQAKYRKLRRGEGSDGWLYGLLKNEEWDAIDKAAGTTMRLLFV